MIENNAGPPEFDRLIGERIDEYLLEALLGKGGMARVYQAVDVNLNRRVAIKVIDIHHRADEDYVQRFRREAQAIAQLDHAHIVRLYRYGEGRLSPRGDAILYMAMQHINGANLQYVLNSYREDGERIEAHEMRRIIREVCEALDYAHGMGILHRDVKPSNIMLNKQGQAILADFGLAMLSTQATLGEVFGSPYYIAPEQAASSAKAVPQSDLYAVGVILYEMVTGVLPFDGAKPLEVALMHLHDPVPAPRTIRPEINPELETVILRALEKNPEDRYPSGKALAAALDRALKSSPEAPVTRLTIPQRVSLYQVDRDQTTLSELPGAARNGSMNGDAPLASQEDRPVTLQRVPPLSPSQPETIPGPAGTGDAQRSMPEAGSPPSAYGIRQRQRSRWALAIFAGMLLTALCAGSGALLLTRVIPILNSRTPASRQAGLLPTQTVQPTAAGMIAQPTQTKTLAQPLPPIYPTAAGSTLYKFKITRQGKDKSYLIITNIGSSEIPLHQISMEAKKGELSGSDLYVERLAPGECLAVQKKDSRQTDLSSLVSCQLIGSTVVVSNSEEGLFREEMDVFWGDEKIGECARDETMCLFSFEE